MFYHNVCSNTKVLPFFFYVHQDCVCDFTWIFFYTEYAARYLYTVLRQEFD